MAGFTQNSYFGTVPKAFFSPRKYIVLYYILLRGLYSVSDFVIYSCLSRSRTYTHTLTLFSRPISPALRPRTIYSAPLKDDRLPSGSLTNKYTRVAQGGREPELRLCEGGGGFTVPNLSIVYVPRTNTEFSISTFVQTR